MLDKYKTKERWYNDNLPYLNSNYGHQKKKTPIMTHSIMWQVDH